MQKVITSSLVAAALLICGSVAFTAPVFNTGFEASQGYAAGALDGQGVPAWYHGYTGYEGGCSVVDTQAMTGTQSMFVSGYATATQTLSALTYAPWFEFAFQPAFDGVSHPQDVNTPNGSLDQIMIKTIRGGLGDIEGLQIRMLYGTGMIEFADKDRGWVAVAPFTNGQWSTISVKHELSTEPGYEGIYTGSYDVYVNGEYKDHIYSPSVPDYNMLRTIVFTGTDDTWMRGGSMYFDDINISDHSQYVGLAKITASVSLADYSQDMSTVGIMVDLIQNGVTMRTVKVFPDVTGAIAVDKVISGTYDIAIKNNASLRKVISGVVVEADVDLGAITLGNGDLDGDNEITSTDLSILGLNLGMTGD